MSIKKKCVKNAPEFLIEQYDQKKYGVGRRLLHTLLTSQYMAEVWKELSKTIRTDKGWNEVFQLVCLAKLRSKKLKRNVTRSEEQRKYLRYSKKLRELSEKIEGTELDVLAYEILSDDLLRIYGLDNFHEYDSIEKATLAAKVLPDWPTVHELLENMAVKAEYCSKVAIEKNRASISTNPFLKEREFIFSLGNSFKELFGEYKYSTVANITNAVFKDNKRGNIDKGFVQKVMKKKGV